MSLAQLDGVRVVDFTQALSGPYCTMMLADLGADVLKVEAPGRGDDARHWGPPFVGDDAAYFVSVNRNKRSVALDLKDPSDLRRALELVGTADVLVENWRPGTAGRLGLGADHLRALNPRLVYCSISGYGQEHTRSGYDQIVQGTSGSMSLTGPPGEPAKWGVPVGDLAAGMFAATAIVSVLYERERTGRGRVVDIAMQDSLVSMLTHHAARFLQTGRQPPSDHNGHATIAPYGAFRAADGFVNICVGNDSQFQRMCRALGLAELGADPRFRTNPDRVVNKQQMLAVLEPAIGARTVSDVVSALKAVGVPVGPVRDLRAVLADPETLARDMVLDVARADGPAARVVNTPWKIDGQAPGVRLPWPALDEHATEALPAGTESHEQL